MAYLSAQWEVWPGDTKYIDKGAERKPRSGVILPLQFTHGKSQNHNLTSRDGPRKTKSGTRTAQLARVRLALRKEAASPNQILSYSELVSGAPFVGLILGV